MYMEAVNTDTAFVLFWVQSKRIKRVMSETAGVTEFLDLLYADNNNNNNTAFL